MRTIYKILLVLFLVIGYILTINIFANLILITSNNQEITTKTIIKGGTTVNIGVSESVSVTVTRNKFYGTIIINNGKEYLYLFDFIMLPKKIKNYNFIWFHLIFLSIIILVSILIFIKPKENGI